MRRIVLLCFIILLQHSCGGIIPAMRSFKPFFNRDFVCKDDTKKVVSACRIQHKAGEEIWTFHVYCGTGFSSAEKGHTINESGHYTMSMKYKKSFSQTIDPQTPSYVEVSLPDGTQRVESQGSYLEMKNLYLPLVKSESGEACAYICGRCEAAGTWVPAEGHENFGSERSDGSD